MEGRGSDVEYWRGETHLGLSLPVSARRFPRPRVVSRVHASFPVSARRCPRPRIVALVPASLPVSACCCPCLRVIARICLRSWAWVVAFVGGRLSSFVGNGSVVVGSRWWVVVSPRGWR